MLANILRNHHQQATMTTDIFDFWGQISPSQKIHPADKPIFDRLRTDGHNFNLNTLPGCFAGPLKTAKIVLLYMSPGLSPYDEEIANTKEGQKLASRYRTGHEPLRESDTPGSQWWQLRTNCFGVDKNVIAQNTAILNIGAYHSKTMEDPELLAALPSCRVALNWAQTVLFPQAISGDRIVICLRAAKFWGLRQNSKYGKSLYAPKVNRTGYMNHTPLREEIIASVKKKVKKL